MKKNTRNQIPSKIKNQPVQNGRSPFPQVPAHNRLKPNRKLPNRKSARPSLSRDKQRPIITKRKQQTSNPVKQVIRTPSIPKLISPMSKNTRQKEAPSKKQRTKADLLDRPRSHNPTKDVPLVKYQSIILEEPIESENVERSKNKPPIRQSKNPLKHKNDKESKMPKSSSVNYGYHPIIDFFPQYRFDAAHK